MITDADCRRVVDAALAARADAYAPYSKFAVGAAVLTASGSVFPGCNVENSSYGLTICAERVAATSAVAAGQREFVAVAVATSGGHAPCGACRQFLAEFGGSMQVVLVDTDHLESGNYQTTTLDILLPRQFRI